MTPALVIRREVEAELKTVYDWYEEKETGLGDQFLLCIDAAFSAIRRSPGMFPIVHKQVRRVLIRRFPYGIYYLVEEKKIAVIAVFHARRNPMGWKTRKR